MKKVEITGLLKRN